MQNLAYKIEIPMYDEVPTAKSQAESCAACGEKLFGNETHDTSWQP